MQSECIPIARSQLTEVDTYTLPVTIRIQQSSQKQPPNDAW